MSIFICCCAFVLSVQRTVGASSIMKHEKLRHRQSDVWQEWGGGGLTDKRSDSFLSRSSLEVGEEEEAAEDEAGRRQPSSLSMPSTGYAMAHTRCKQAAAAAAAFDEAAYPDESSCPLLPATPSCTYH